jgi:hypothetical protein
VEDIKEKRGQNWCLKILLMNTEEIKSKILNLIVEAENLIPIELEQNLLPSKLSPKVPEWDIYERKIWKNGEIIRQLFSESKGLLKDQALTSRIMSICINRKSKRGRQSFILLLGNTDCEMYADKLITELEDKFVYGQIIMCIYKMKSGKYVDKIKSFCEVEETWVKNIAKKYVLKYS